MEDILYIINIEEGQLNPIITSSHQVASEKMKIARIAAKYDKPNLYLRFLDNRQELIDLAALMAEGYTILPPFDVEALPRELRLYSILP